MPQPRYFPFLHGVYDVKAGIESLGRDHGNGDADGRAFQLDAHFPVYRACKLAATRQPARHILRDGLPPATERAVALWVADRLVAEHPGQFVFEGGNTEAGCLRCSLTSGAIDLAAEDAPLDALALQVQCDWAVLELGEDGSNRVSYLHVAMPSGWPPEAKIGQPFDAIHRPVPHIEAINAKQAQIAKLMVNATRGAVRFAWTVTTDAALDHHPMRDADAPATTPLADHPAGDPLLRVERQVIWGFPKHRASLFTIRTYLYPLADLDAPARGALAAAVAGMSEASLRYKNMDRPAILAWLAGDPR